MRKLFAYICGFASFLFAGFASGAKEGVNWVAIAKPYLIASAISLILALVLYNWNHIRRITYPAIVCVLAWLYEHKIVATEFSKQTYRVYVYFGRSYKRFYRKVQYAFEQYLKASAEV